MLELMKIDLLACPEALGESCVKEAYDALEEKFAGDYIKESFDGKVPASVKLKDFTEKDSFENAQHTKIYYIVDAEPQAKISYSGNSEEIISGDSFSAGENEEVFFSDASVIEIGGEVFLAEGVKRIEAETVREGKGNYKTDFLKSDGFNVSKHKIKEKTGFVSTKKSLDIIIITEGRARMFYDGASLAVNKGECILVPAYIGKYTVEGNCEFLRVDFI